MEVAESEGGFMSYDELQDLDMDMIKDVTWAKNMHEQITKCVTKAFLNWYYYVNSVTNDEKQIMPWRDVFINQLEVNLCDVVWDMKCLEQKVLVRLEELLKQLQQICTDLRIDMPTVGSERQSLLEEQKQLKQKIEEYDAKRKARKREVDMLKEKQFSLCKCLGKEPRILKDSPLPTAEEIEEFQKHVEHLDSEKFRREEIFINLKEEILSIATELKAVPYSDFEKQILQGEDTDFLVTMDNMKQLEFYHASLKKELQSTKEEIQYLYQEVERLWNMLEIDIMEREKFKKAHSGNSLTTLEALRLEQKRCEELKKQNIKVFIDKLRKELHDMWDLCHCGGPERSSFQYLYSDTYTEDLLELHEVEVNKWQRYYDENREILELREKHEKLWKRMIELEQNANDANRFKNRGGQLLREEKERNKLTKMIPKIEEDLYNLCTAFEKQHKKPFLSFGRTVESYIEELHAKREDEKKLKSSARKQKHNMTVTPPHPGAGATGGGKSMKTLFATPTPRTAGASVMSASKRKMTPPTTVGSSKKIRAGGTPAKPINNSRLRPVRERTMPVPVKVKVTSGRLSLERKKRANKIKAAARSILKRTIEELDLNTTVSTEYNDFEKDLSNKENQRSTLTPVELVHAATASTSKYAKTPTRVQKSPKTPSKSASRLAVYNSAEKSRNTTPRTTNTTRLAVYRKDKNKSPFKLIF